MPVSGFFVDANLLVAVSAHNRSCRGSSECRYRPTGGWGRLIRFPQIWDAIGAGYGNYDEHGECQEYQSNHGFPSPTLSRRTGRRRGQYRCNLRCSRLNIFCWWRDCLPDPLFLLTLSCCLPRRLPRSPAPFFFLAFLTRCFQIFLLGPSISFFVPGSLGFCRFTFSLVGFGFRQCLFEDAF